MMRALEVASLFLGFGLIGVGGDYASELVVRALRDQPAPERLVDVDVDVEVAEPHVDVSVQVRGSGSCAYEAQRTADVPASTDHRLRVSAGSGELSVRGVQGLGQVRVVARACASRADYLEDLQITLAEGSGEIVLSAHYPERSGFGFGDNYARLDLVLEVPLAMTAQIEDGSGGMEIAGTGTLRIQDSSGDILVSDVLGPVEIEDSSGAIELLAVTGGMTIRDSSGGIRIENATGDVAIEDGSGEVELRVVRGAVRIEDGSGDIDAEQVDGSVTVGADGSGSIDVTDVTGDFTVLRGGSGSIEHSGVGGRVDIPVRRGRRGDG